MKFWRGIALLMIYLIILLPVAFAVSISDISADAGTNDVTITWNTDVDANSKIDYGMTSELGQTAFDSGVTRAHSMYISGLNDGQSYRYKITSVDLSSDTDESGTLTFNTIDGTAPVAVVGLEVVESTYTSIKFKWTANSEPDLAKYIIFFEGTQIGDTTSTEHLVDGLQPGNNYLFEVAAVDSTGNVGSKGSISLSTQDPDVSAPTITNITLSESTVNSMRISWSTSEKSKTHVFWGIGEFSQEIEEGTLKLQHSQVMTGLIEKEVYQYKIVACDEWNNCATSPVREFPAGVDVVPPTIEFEIPTLYNKRSLDVTVIAEEKSRLDIYVNERKAATGNSGDEGVYTFDNVPLDTTRSENIIRVVAVDLFDNEAELSKTMTLDLDAPKVVINDLPAKASEGALFLNGTVGEDVEFAVITYLVEEAEVPAKVENVEYDDLTNDSVKLSWDSVDADHYYVYRDDVGRLEYTELTGYLDETVSPDHTYTYRVSGVKDCEEGEQSNPLNVVMPTIGAPNTNVAYAYGEECKIERTPVVNQTISGTFSESIPLQEGLNYVKISMTDLAGNAVVKEGYVSVDTNDPIVESVSFSDHSPAYATMVTVKGKVSEKTTVYIFQNTGTDTDVLVSFTDGISVKTDAGDDPRYTVETDDDGNFEVDITMRRDAEWQCSDDTHSKPSCTVGDDESSWENNFIVVAVDAAGRESDPVTDYILYSLCGSGSAHWNIETSQISPSVLIPRNLIEGVAEFGFSYDLVWQGPGDDGTPTGVGIVNGAMSTEESDMFDNEWISNRHLTKSSDGKSGYVLVQLKTQDVPGNTSLEQSNNLSDHNKGLCGGGITDIYGCARFFLQLEIPYTYVDPYNGNTTVGTYKHCIRPIEIAIDRRLPSDAINKEFLNASVRVITAAISAIDIVLKPLKTIRNYVFMACLGSWVVWFVMKVAEWGSCKTSITGLLGKTCNPYSDDDEEAEECQGCLDAKMNTAQMWYYSQWLCDRIMCNSAPTYEKYVRNQKGVKESHCYELAGIADENIKNTHFDEYNEVYDIKYNQADLDEIVTEKDAENQALDELRGKYGNFNYGISQNEEGMKDYYKLEKTDCDGKGEGENKRYFQILPPPGEGPSSEIIKKANEVAGDTGDVYSDKCCKREYDRYADSVCLMMDELKESGCLNQKTADDDKMENMGLGGCDGVNEVIRTVAGVCSKQDLTDLTMSVPSGQATKTGGPLKVHLKSRSDGRCVYPVEVTGEEAKIDYEKEVQESSSKGFGGKKISSGETDKFYVLGDEILCTADCAKPGETGEYYTYDDWKKSNPNAKKTYLGKLAVPGEDFITSGIYSMVCQDVKDEVVDPTSGIIRSVQCGCLTGVVSYLALWKSVLIAAKNCFMTILYTGDGSSGMCKSFLSVTLCDMIYYAIKCIIEHSSKSVSGTKKDNTGLGGFIGYVSDSGSAVEGGISNRYGSSSVYKSLFTERKLMHAVCAFAFTGDMDFDVNTFLDEEAPTPVESIAVVAPAFRRFQTTNPAKMGRASFNYEVGALLVAGADLSYRIELVCSADNSCDTSEGFTNGYCDCFYTGQEETQTILTGALKITEVLNEDILFNVKDADYRYDRARLVFEYTDNNGKRIINDDANIRVFRSGGVPPLDCKVDVLANPAFFHCDFEWGELSCAKFIEKPRLTSSEGSTTGVLTKNMKIRLYGEIEKQVPTSESTEQFYIRARLTDEGSGVVMRDEKKQIGGGGSTDLSTFDFPGWKVEDLFQTVGVTSRYPENGGTTISGDDSKLQAGDPLVSITFKTTDGTEKCADTNKHTATITVSDSSKVTISEGKTKADAKHITSLNAVEIEGADWNIFIDYDSGATFEVRGSPMRTVENSPGQCEERVGINPPVAKGGREAPMKLEVTIHRADDSGEMVNDIIQCEGEAARTVIGFRMTNTESAISGGCPEGVTREPCDCNEDGDKDDANKEFTLDTQKYALDCDVDNYKYCIERGVCTGFEECYKENQRECFYKKASDWKFCATYFYDGECHDDQRAGTKTSCEYGVKLANDCECSYTEGTKQIIDSCVKDNTCYPIGCEKEEKCSETKTSDCYWEDEGEWKICSTGYLSEKGGSCSATLI